MLNKSRPGVARNISSQPPPPPDVNVEGEANDHRAENEFISHHFAPWAFIHTALKLEGAGGGSFMDNWAGDFYFALTGREVSGCDGLHNVMRSKRGFEKRCDTLQTKHLQVWWFLKTISNNSNLKVWCGTQIWRVLQTSMCRVPKAT